MRSRSTKPWWARSLPANDADPIGLLEVVAPRDEYDPEMGTIAPRVSKAAGVDETHRIIREEFARWFGSDTAGPLESYEPLARAYGRLSLNFGRRPEAAHVNQRRSPLVRAC